MVNNAENESLNEWKLVFENPSKEVPFPIVETSVDISGMFFVMFFRSQKFQDNLYDFAGFLSAKRWYC